MILPPKVASGSSITLQWISYLFVSNDEKYSNWPHKKFYDTRKFNQIQGESF